MFDLGTSFTASVARDPGALAIVDGDVRLSYAQWLAKISSLVAAFDGMGLQAGDHLVTMLQNRWEAASLHWACQFAGLTIVPINWRAKPDEIDFVIENCGASAVAFEAVAAQAMAESRLARAIARIAVGADAGRAELTFAEMVAVPAPAAVPRARPPMPGR